MPSPPPKLVEKVASSLTIPGAQPGETVFVTTGVTELQAGDIGIVNFPNGIPAGLVHSPADVVSPPVPPQLQIAFTNVSAVATGTQNVPMQVLIAR